MSTPLNTELSSIISRIVDIVTLESGDIEKELRQWANEKETLEKLARTTELRIQRAQVNKIKKKMHAILKASENLIVLSTIKVTDN